MSGIMKTKTIKKSVINGDLIFRGKVVFLNDIRITGTLNVDEVEARKSIAVAKDYIVRFNDKVGGHQEVGEYHNPSFRVLDLEKITTQRIVFTSSIYHERNFWLTVLENSSKKNSKAYKELNYIIQTGCWDEIATTVKKYKKEILACKQLLPAMRQAIEVLCKRTTE